MDIFNYLDENQKECFSRNSISFEKGREKYVAYLGRYPVGELDLAIIVRDNGEVYLDLLGGNSL